MRTVKKPQIRKQEILDGAIGGMNRHHPSPEELEAAIRFYEGLW